jgi:hypothetical protein
MFLERPKKSERLTDKEKVLFAKWIAKQPTKTDAAEVLAVSLPTLLRIAGIGSCHPRTAIKIREVI